MSRRLTSLTALTALALSGITLLGGTSASAAVTCDADFDHLAHRFAAGLAPENTEAGMAIAVLSNPTHLETDVQLTEDGKIVFMHDATLARTTNVETVFPGREADPVNTFTLAELQQLDAGSWFDSRFAGEKIPTFNSILDYTSPTGVGVAIELKEPALSPGLVPAIDQALDSDPRWQALIDAGRLTFTSFDAPTLKEMQPLRPTVPLVWVSSLVPDDAALAEAATWADSVATHYRTLGTGDIARIQGFGLTVVLYTLDSPEAMTAALNDGADAIITDYPNVLDAVCHGEDPFPQANGVVVASVLADPPGSDIQPENGEYVVLRNTTGSTVDVSGYHLIDAVGNRLSVGAGYTIPAGGELRVYTGPGTDTATRYYNGGTANVLNNNGDSLGLNTPGHELLDVYAY